MNTKTGYIVELEKGVWLTCLEGPIDRTVCKSNAKIFSSKFTALHKIQIAQEIRPFRNAKIEKVIYKIKFIDKEIE